MDNRSRTHACERPHTRWVVPLISGHQRPAAAGDNTPPGSSEDRGKTSCPQQLAQPPAPTTRDHQQGNGGEALIQVGFVSQCLTRLKEQGIHTAIDTAGNVPWSYFARVVDRTDLFLYDIKAIDEDAHRRGTGVSGRRVLDNARRLAEAGKTMWIRLVVIPGWNDAAADLAARVRFAASLGPAVERVDLLGYHTLGVGKHLRLGMDYELSEIPAVDEALIDSVLELGRELGLAIKYEPGVQAAARRTSVRGRIA